MLNQNFEQSPVFDHPTTSSAVDTLQGLKSLAKNDATKSVIQEQIDGIVKSEKNLEAYKASESSSAVAPSEK